MKNENLRLSYLREEVEKLELELSKKTNYQDSCHYAARLKQARSLIIKLATESDHLLFLKKEKKRLQSLWRHLQSAETTWELEGREWQVDSMIRSIEIGDIVNNAFNDQQENMNRREKNEAIAKLLGFEKYGITVNGVPNAQIAWNYPDEYSYLIRGVPMHAVPDFIGMFEKLRKISEII